MTVTRRLALAGIFGPPFFVAVFLIVGVVKPRYDPVVLSVSNGSIGELGWIQICNFLVLGVALLVFAIGAWRGFGDRLSGRIGSALMAATGIGMFCAGVFVSDPGNFAVTTHGNLHMAASLVVFLALLVGSFVFARYFWSDRRFAIYSIASGLAIPVSFAATFALRPGLSERLMLIVVLTWIAVLALRLRRASTTTISAAALSVPTSAVVGSR